jgi:hypothetical protein
MSKLYDFLTHDPNPRGWENGYQYHVRCNRRRAIQRLIIRSFPREFQRLDESVLREALHKLAGEGKNGIVAANVSTFTGRDRLAHAMTTPLRERYGKDAPVVDPDEMKALRWLKSEKYQSLPT